jgi:hypothetical protein
MRTGYTNADSCSWVSRWVTLGFAILLCRPAPTQAGISFVNMFRANAFSQSGDGNTLSGNGSFLSLGLASENAGEFATAVATYPGPGSPVPLVSLTSTQFWFQTSSYASQAAMDADFPFGTYQFDAAGGGGTDSTSFDYLADAYSQTLPYLAGGSYSALQGMNPTAPLAVDFSPMTPDPATSEAFVFFTIRDNGTDTIVFDGGFMPSTTAGITIPAKTLAPNTSYTYELIFSDRVQLPSPGAVFDAQIGFDLRTTGSFATVPEPANWVLAWGALAALLCGGAAMRRRSAGKPTSGFELG